MTDRRAFMTSRLILPLAGLVLLSGSGGYWLASRSNSSGGGEHGAERIAAGDESGRGEAAAPPIELPKRIEADRHAKAEPPPVPAALQSPPELTAELEVRTPHGVVQRKIVTRTVERVHVQLGEQAGAPEWLFVRNPVDPRRVTGLLVDHQHEAILEHDESALRSAGIAQGWVDVVGFGVTSDALKSVAQDAQERSFAGQRFTERRAAVDPAAGSLRELWWSDEACVPLVVRAVADGIETTTELRGLRLDVDRSRLADPRARFPGYRVVDAIDWLEQNHDHGDHEHAANARASNHAPHGDHAPGP